ncbi:MAG: hypothetical protein EBY83_02110, partial [Verrucomicrobia bacterium]|nr:hypothetical protein [Verrucomicrobiota bacterium]
RKGLAEAKGRGVVHGWVKDLATMIRAHDLVVTKPGTISVREVLATGRPAILVEGGKGAEKRKGICRLATRIGCGALADSPGEIAARIKDALEGGGVGLREWGRRARKEANRSAGAMERLAGRIAKMARAAQSTERVPELRLVMHGYSGRKGLLMVDLHTHSIFSDGRLTLREIVDFYGRRGFDAMAVTDHLVDRRRLLGRLASLSGLVLTLEDLPEYFRALAEERNRAWRFGPFIGGRFKGADRSRLIFEGDLSANSRAGRVDDCGAPPPYEFGLGQRHPLFVGAAK